jgi:uncharacterized repeat protein (TIGR03843 family)
MARRKRTARFEGSSHRQPIGTSWSPDQPNLTDLLRAASITACRPIMWGSNGTFLVTLCADGEAGESHAVYKPRRGEAPLWDFPRGTLYRREMATYLVSEALGWSLVPPTVVREGPYGIGSVQLFIEHDPSEYFHSPVRHDRAAAEQIALLDVMLNNADRKSEHCLRGLDGKVWAIDHGLTFHTDPKLRTVIWDFAGDPIADDLLADMQSLCEALEARDTVWMALRQLVNVPELMAVSERAQRLLQTRTHPDPGMHRRAQPWGGW